MREFACGQSGLGINNIRIISTSLIIEAREWFSSECSGLSYPLNLSPTKFYCHSILMLRQEPRSGCPALKPNNGIYVCYYLLLNSQPRIMHFAYSDWFTQSWLSAHIP